MDPALAAILKTIVSGVFFLIFLSMFKNFIAKGCSIAIAEFLLKNADKTTQERLCRFFGNGKEVLEELSTLKELGLSEG